MFILAMLSLFIILVMGAIYYLECNVVEDLPDSNKFKRWWRKHLVGNPPEDLW
jgi:membrane carboxypeptidase/penicillin-binding protein